ncbi:hypothetical protein D3C75_653320 [compost metagenome]
MIDVAVGINDGNNRSFTAIFIVQIHPDLRGLGGHQRIDNGDPLFTFHDGHVREIEVTNLINAVGYLEQATNID